MKQVCTGVLFALVGVSFPLTATADPISVTFVSRMVVAFATGSGSGDYERRDNSDNLVASSSFEGAHAFTSLFSQASTRALSGSLSAWASRSASADTDYFVEFDTTQPQQFSFTGDFASSGLFFGNGGYWEAYLYHVPPNGSVRAVSVFDYKGWETRSAATAGLLPPGHYGFRAEAAAFTSDPARTYADQTFKLSFGPAAAPTPEPATALLLGAGLLALIRRARHH